MPLYGRASQGSAGLLVTKGQGPTVRRRRLASELRRLREAANLTIDEVGAKLECSASKISRIETGHVGVTPRDVRDLLELYGVSGEERDSIVQFSREARQRGWWHSYNEVFTDAFVGLEADATSLRSFQALLVPGLLQTEQYAYHVMQAMRPDASETELRRRVAARLTRQELLTDSSPPEYWAIIDEAVLRRTVGGAGVMVEQYQKLIAMAELPHITLQMAPFGVGGHAGMEGPFLILGFPEKADPDVVYVESAFSGAFLESPPDVARCTLMFNHLVAASLSPEDTISEIQRAATQLSQ